MTFVVPAAAADAMGEGSYMSDFIERSVVGAFGATLAYDLFEGLEPLGYGRAPYKYGYQNHKTGLTIWAGGATGHVCVEFSGKGCAWLTERGKLLPVLDRLAETLSRFDVALDLEQSGEPEEFLKSMKLERQKTSAKFSSPSGNTVYIGSVHSERYMRVYRYASPHPRSHLLRLETVFRRQNAKQAGRQAIFGGLETVARAAGTIFGFDHLIDWDESVEVADLSIYRAERNGGKTLNWLLKQVAPAIQRLVKDGTIPRPREFFESYFLTDPDTGESIG